MTTRRPQSARLARAALALPAALAVSLLLTTCGGGGGPARPPNPPAPLTITTTSLPDAISGQAYSHNLAAQGGSPPYTWSLGEASGPLPPGLTLNSGGLISGVPGATQGGGYGIFGVAFQVRDSKSAMASISFYMYVVEPLTITTTSLPDGNIAVPYQGWISFSGGRPPWTWSLAQGSNPLPSGLTIGGVGGYYNLVSGTPTQPGTYSFNVQGKDSGNPGQTATASVRLFIDNRLVITTRTLPCGVLNWPYKESLEAMGGNPPYTWTAVGTLPPGVSLSSSGELAGTPLAEGSFDFLVQVTDSASPPQALQAPMTLTIRPPLRFVTSTLPSAIQNVYYGQYVALDGGRGPFTLRVSSGALPPGLSFEQTTQDWSVFYLRGTPTGVGSFTFTLEASDSLSPPEVVTREFTIRVDERLVITTTSLPDGWMNQPYSATLQATGGTSPYVWSVERLPEGFTFDSATGQLSGMLSWTYSYNEWLSFRVRDSGAPAQEAWASLYLRITAPLVISTSRLPAGRPNVLYRVGLEAIGGWGVDSWRVKSGNLPTGLTLKQPTNWSPAEISGTATAEGTSTFTLEITDDGPPAQTATRQLTLRISSSLGRNDAIATATPISNGTIHASISPYADPVSGPASPDNDYYELSANVGAVVHIQTYAFGGISPASPIDTVIEIVDANGTRFTTCDIPGDSEYVYDAPCLNDDEAPSTLDSLLNFQVPGTGSEPVTFYIHVLDWSGSARPDFVYDLTVSGAN